MSSRHRGESPGKPEVLYAKQPRTDPTHFVQYGNHVQAQHGRAPTFALRTGGGYVFATGTPAREKELEDKVAALEKHLAEVTSERNVLIIDLRDEQNRCDEARSGRASAVEQVAYHVGQHRLLEEKYLDSLNLLEKTRQDAAYNLETTLGRGAAEKSSLSTRLDVAKNEAEEVRRKLREELAMAEIKANGLRDLIQQLRQEKQEQHDAHQLLLNEKTKLTVHLEQAHVRACGAETKVGELEITKVGKDQEIISLKSSVAQEEEKVRALKMSLMHLQATARELASCTAGKLALEGEHRGVCEALAARDRHCADLKANVDDLTRLLAAGKSHRQELETKLRLLTDDRDATHFQLGETAAKLEAMEKLKSQVAGSYSSSSEAHNAALRELQAARVREDALARHLEKAREEEAAAKAKHSDLTDDMQVLQSQLEHTKASAASRAAALEAHVQDKCEELVVRVTENVDLQNRLADKKSELEEKVKEVATERAGRHELAADYAATRKMLDVTNMKGSEVQAELVFTLEQLRSTAIQKEHAEEELATAWDDLTHTKNQVGITQRALLAMEGKYGMAEEQLHARGAALSSEEMRAAALANKLAQAEVMCNRYHTEAVVVSEEKSHLAERNDTYAALLTAERREVDMQRRENEAHRRSAATMSGEYQSLSQQLTDYKHWASGVPGVLSGPGDPMGATGGMARLTTGSTRSSPTRTSLNYTSIHGTAHQPIVKEPSTGASGLDKHFSFSE